MYRPLIKVREDEDEYFQIRIPVLKILVRMECAWFFLTAGEETLFGVCALVIMLEISVLKVSSISRVKFAIKI